MDWQTVHSVLVFFQRCVSVIGILIIITGVVFAFVRYLYYIFSGELLDIGLHRRSIGRGSRINDIRLHLGRTLILGLEFIVAADLIGSTTTPDYYAVGLLAIIVMIRTLLSFSINRELMALKREG